MTTTAKIIFTISILATGIMGFLFVQSKNSGALLEKENSVLISNIKIVRDSVSDIQNDLISSNLEKDRLSEEFETTKKSYTELILDLNKIQDEFIKIEERTSQQDELEYLLVQEYQNLAREGDVGKKSSQVNEIKAQLNTVHNLNLQSLRKMKSMNEEINMQGFEITALQTMVNDLQTQIEIKERKILKSQSQVNNLEEKIRILNAEINSSSEEWAKEKALSEAKIIEMEREIQNQTSINIELKNENANFRTKNSDLINKNENLQMLLNDQKAISINLRTEINELEKREYFIPDCAKAHYLFATKEELLNYKVIIKEKRNGTFRINTQNALKYATTYNFQLKKKFNSKGMSFLKIVYPKKPDKYYEFSTEVISIKDNSINKEKLIVCIVENSKIVEEDVSDY